MPKGYLLVEGHGDVAAAGNLIGRLWAALGTPLVWAPPIRWKNLHRDEGVKKAAEFVRRKPDAGALLLLRDEDDHCPRTQGPRLASSLRACGLPFPAAVVLLHPEYEVLFLPCLDQMAGQPLGSGNEQRPGLRPGTRWDHPGDWEHHRGIKEYLTAHFPANRSYKPTTDQLLLTRMIDLEALRAAEVPCFGTLERALGFLAGSPAAGEVYPAPPTRT